MSPFCQVFSGHANILWLGKGCIDVKRETLDSVHFNFSRGTKDRTLALNALAGQKVDTRQSAPELLSL